MILMKLAILGTLFSKLCVIGALAANGTILQSFPGASGPGCKPAADTTGAVGSNHVVDFADSSFKKGTVLSNDTTKSRRSASPRNMDLPGH
jgi:hypothetical protein